MRIELIAQDDQVGLGIGLDQSCYMFSEVCFGSRVPNCWGDEFASCQVDIAGQDLCAVSDVVERVARSTCPSLVGKVVPSRGSSLDAWFFVGADDVNALGFVLFLGCSVQFADLLDLLSKFIPVLNIGVLPIPAPMRLECGLLLKNARVFAGEMVLTIPLSTTV